MDAHRGRGRLSSAFSTTLVCLFWHMFRYSSVRSWISTFACTCHFYHSIHMCIQANTHQLTLLVSNSIVVVCLPLGILPVSRSSLFVMSKKFRVVKLTCKILRNLHSSKLMPGTKAIWIHIISNIRDYMYVSVDL